jgi:hypothetical protein
MLLCAQAPAGPHRPVGVPDGYVITPFGYFHPSCVVRLSEGDALLEDGRVIQRADGDLDNISACGYPHYTSRGEIVTTSTASVEAPAIPHSWIEDAEVTTGTSYGKLIATWNVPAAPTSNDGQTLFFFPGMDDYQDNVGIIQPVLGWNADFGGAWGIASWDYYANGNSAESSPVRVNPGDTIQGNVWSTCSAGILSCPAWNITTLDVSSGKSTTLSHSSSNGMTFNWAYGGALEVYNVAQCSDYPPNGSLTLFDEALYDYNFDLIPNPGWSIVNRASDLAPQCNYGGQATATQVTLDYAPFEPLAVATVGSGTVTSFPSGISCPGTCSGKFAQGSPVTLTASAAAGDEFSAWSGACTGSGTCTVAMSSSESVTATFVPSAGATCAATPQCIGSGNFAAAVMSLSCTSATQISTSATLCGLYGSGGCTTSNGPSGVLTSSQASASGEVYSGATCSWSWCISGSCHQQSMSP